MPSHPPGSMSDASGFTRRAVLGSGLGGAAFMAAPHWQARTGDPQALGYRGFGDRGTQAFLGIRYARAARFARPRRARLAGACAPPATNSGRCARSAIR